MNPYTVEFVEHRSITEMMPIVDAYKIKPKGRAQWLQRLAWRFLNRCGALEQAYEPTVNVTRHLVDADTFIHRLLKQKRNLLEHFHKDGQRLIIGSEDYAELMCSSEMTPHYFNFSAEIGLGRNIVGLRVEVVPWMRGAVVMP